MKNAGILKKGVAYIMTGILLLAGVNSVHAMEMMPPEEMIQQTAQYREGNAPELTEQEAENAGIVFEEETVKREAGNSMTSAADIALNGSVNGTFSSDENRTDFYRVTVPGNSSVCLNIRVIQYLYVLYVRVYDSGGNKIIDRGLEWNSKVFE